MKIEFHTTKPQGADLEDMAQFIRDAVTSWGGSLHPEDPMFGSLVVLEIKVHGKTFKFYEGEGYP